MSRHLLVNYIWIDAESITVGATDDERWGWELEDGHSGAEAFSFVQATIADPPDGCAPFETVSFLIKPGYEPHRTLAESTSALFFGKELSRGTT